MLTPVTPVTLDNSLLHEGLQQVLYNIDHIEKLLCSGSSSFSGFLENEAPNKASTFVSADLDVVETGGVSALEQCQDDVH